MPNFSKTIAVTLIIYYEIFSNSKAYNVLHVQQRHMSMILQKIKEVPLKFDNYKNKYLN